MHSDILLVHRRVLLAKSGPSKCFCVALGMPDRVRELELSKSLDLFLNWLIAAPNANEMFDQTLTAKYWIIFQYVIYM